MIRTFLFIFLFGTSASALPIATAEQFSEGNYWVWNYYENGDRSKLYSSEKYLISNISGDEITFEIWTKYAGKLSFTPSAKFKVSLDDCRRAFNGRAHHPFTVDMHSHNGNQWSTDAYQAKSTAFEEKFNCNPTEYPANDPHYVTNYDFENTPWGNERLFQQKAKIPNQVLSYYFADHRFLTGVAYKKEFNPNSPYEFEMELVEAKR